MDLLLHMAHCCGVSVQGSIHQPAGTVALAAPDDAPTCPLPIDGRSGPATVVSVPEESPVAALAPTATVAPPTQHWLVCAVLLGLGMFLSTFNSFGLSVVLTAIQKDFLALTQDMQWVSTGYRLTMGIAIPLSVWLADRLGLRRLYVLVLAMFGAMSLLCVFANNLETLVVLRVLQAIPGALVPVTCITMLGRIIPAARMRPATCLYIMGAMSGLGLGPVLAASVTDNLGWRWVFALEVPVSVIAVLAALVVLPTVPGNPERRFDLPGFVTIASGLCALMVAISQGQQWGWTSYKVLLLLAVGTNALALFVGIELWVKHPLLNVRVFAHRSFVVALILVELAIIGMSSTLSYLPTFLQKIQGLSATSTGLGTVPAGLTFMVMLIGSVLLNGRFGSRWPVIVGMTTMAIGMLTLARITADIPRLQVIVGACVVLGGAGMSLMPVMSAVLASLPQDLLGDGMVFRVTVQRIIAPVGFTAFSTLATVEQTQLYTSQTGLIQSGDTSAGPEMAQLRDMGSQGLTALAQRVQLMAQAHAIGNVFLLIGLIMAGAAVVVLVTGWGRPPRVEA